MKKSLLILVILLFLTACASATPESTQTQPPPPTSPPEPTSTPEPTATAEPTSPPQPSGPRVVFASNRGEDPNKTDLYILNIDSGEVTPLNTGFDAVFFPKWSPDGTKILFAVWDAWNLYTVNADGSNLTQLTDFRSNNADWSPDGSQIVFQSDHRNEPKDTPDLYLIDANGENLSEILDQPKDADYMPRWVGSDKIAFLSDRSGHAEIYTINIDGSQRTQITDGKASIGAFAVSSDGTRLVFTYPQGDNFANMYSIDISGDVGSAIRLTSEATRDENPAWLPDGSAVIYNTDKGGNMDLWTVSADGTDFVQLTDDEYYDLYPDYWMP